MGIRQSGVDPAEHKDAEKYTAETSLDPNTAPRFSSYANTATIMSQSIATSKRCCIVVVTTCVLIAGTQKTQIQRGGVDKTKETDVTSGTMAFTGGYGHLQYASEVLDAGTYVYALVNSSGASLKVYGETMKLVAVSAS
jgi:hypothetical protein